ncbi:Nucleotidyl transferase AbiEii toxin, Type IV TA system [Candidatus Desulfarcum epimagneticum]|uniref:Nucleotidyl transferase AbiEii toxin, Type IV TA system n=1 Tax=uncultured Desulfobacteraceae bacterium TaxID=218296 RepID=A0A484HJK6_9BACT|nr:Nucleotidyl transferase AbiEii toxin, Type IV TA system [uncultured Desulfobacteraceae bacterium]
MLKLKPDQIRIAGAEDKEYYENFLYPFQDEIFDLIGSDPFYLGGGTCLSRFYLNHRYSDDIDLFFNGYDFPKENFDICCREIFNRIGDKFDIEIQIDGDYFKRIMAYQDAKPLKMEFIFENYKCPGNRTKKNKIWIDSKENIVTNKITAVYDRKTVKDYIDLYYLLPEFSFEQIGKWAEYKIVPMEYEGVLIAFSEDFLEGSVLMIDDIRMGDFRLFIKKLIIDIFNYAKTTAQKTE